MSIIFDGRAFAEKKILKLDKEVARLKNKGIYPKLASIIVGEDPASKLYVSLKKKKAEGIGVEMDVYYLKEKELLEVVLSLIDSLNSDPTIYGIMVQLPLPLAIRHQTLTIIDSINPKKDVDGLRDDSPFLHPTSKAVIDVINEARRSSASARQAKTICVVGATGMVGKPLVKELKKEGYKVTECNHDTSDLKGKTLEADILISATGKSGLIKKNMVKDGVVLIDVGSPKGDVDPSVALKASFLTPVPGGIGPITISCLLENLVKASEAIV